MVGRLELSMYGTMEAAAAWQAKIHEAVNKPGFVISKFNPCIFWHPIKNIEMMVHGDDFVSAGGEPELQWMRNMLESKFELKTSLIGWKTGQEK